MLLHLIDGNAKKNNSHNYSCYFEGQKWMWHIVCAVCAPSSNYFDRFDFIEGDTSFFELDVGRNLKVKTRFRNLSEIATQLFSVEHPHFYPRPCRGHGHRFFYGGGLWGARSLRL